MNTKRQRCHTTIRGLQPVTVLLYSVAIAVGSCWESGKGCSLSSRDMSGFLSQPGDIIIGGTFLIHVYGNYIQPLFTTNPTDLQCHTFGSEHYQGMHALMFAVQEINKNPELLPNTTLGFQIFDTCTPMRRATQGMFWMLSGRQELTPNYHCNRESRLVGIIGDSGSTKSILMAQILGLHHYPQISYYATSPLLSNRALFPSFFRTIPSDEFQMKGLAQLVSKFGWSWVGLMATDNDYGQYAMQVVKQEVIKAGACIAFFVDIMTSKPDRNAPKIARILRESTAKVIVVMASGADFLIVLEELLRQNVTGKVWVGSEAWASSTFLSVKRFQDVLVGSVGFSIHADQISGFAEYFESLNPSSDLHDPFIKEFWEQAFSCKWLDQDELVNNASLQPCTGKEKLGNVMLKLDFRLSLNVYTAVYAFAWALQNLHDCQLGKGQFEHESCTNISFFQPWQLLYYVKHVNFKTKDGNHIFFDAKGNPPPIYDIINWRVSAKGSTEQIIVGSYNASAPDEKNLPVNTSSILWNTGETQIPLSRCSESCPVGFAKLTLPGKPICCFQCVRCPQGQISNQTDAVMCQQCSWDTWSSFQQDKCIPKAIDFLSYVELLGLSLAAISISSSVVPLCIVSIFMCHKTTPVVRANNYSLSCLLLLSLFLCFLCSLGFIGYPQSEMCLLRQVAFGMVFSLCISSVLAKTITVVIAFTAIQPGSRLKRWTSVKVSYCVVVFCMCIQLSVCMVWFSFSPPFPEHDIITQPGVIIINCNEGSPTAFWCMLGFLGILASISFIVAFLARRLPDSFNEAKFITFSMLAFLTVWISFIPAYFSARGKYTVAMEIFAILSSTWAMVACIFMPKCYIILLRPDMNSREHLMKSGRGQ
ncbi:hypothetical protein XELAEV_18019309mg [Xenopus laevis]|uniref:G-protein coupled receptors family 3 profile domain-containing protein n=1 Tax=Xenopus laevis TaxID=8355 RepID=A0A974HUA6_XENLA|nr:hypothetical protein XELAEV_18019309mg [Xenopus laevis]